MEVRVRELVEADRAWARVLVEQHWGVPVVTPTSAYYEPELQEGVVAEVDNERAGVLTCVRDGDDWEVVVVIAAVEGVGVGRAMLDEVRRLAATRGVKRVWLITTDDTGAGTFCERMGMVRTRTHENFVDVVRKVKPASSGYRDAYEYEWLLTTIHDQS